MSVLTQQEMDALLQATTVPVPYLAWTGVLTAYQELVEALAASPLLLADDRAYHKFQLLAVAMERLKEVRGITLPDGRLLPLEELLGGGGEPKEEEEKEQ